MKENIIRMAHEAGLCDDEGRDDDSIIITEHLERFATLVASAEREACAKLAFNAKTYIEAATAIRARGQA